MNASPTLDYNPTSLALADGAAVSAWNDSQASGNNLTQATGANQPLYYSGSHANAVNGQPVVRFDGSNDSLGCTLGATIAQPLTLFLVLRVDMTSTKGTYPFRETANDLFFSSNRWQVNGLTAQATLPTAGVHIMEVVWNGASSSLTIDGAEVNQQSYGSTGFAKFFLGSTTTGTQCWKGDVARALLYGGTPSSADRTVVRNGLAATYGVTLDTGGNYSYSIASGTINSKAWKAYAPKPYTAGVNIPLFVWCHGMAGNSALLDLFSEGYVVDKLLQAGFIVAILSAGDNSWGNPATVDDMVTMYTTLAATYTINRVVVLGESMGGQNAANVILDGRIPNIKGFVGLYPSLDLAKAYTGATANSAFTSNINTAYGITGTTPNTYAEKTAGRDPMLFSATQFAGIRGRFYASAGDLTVSKALNTDAFITRFGGSMAESSLYTATGVHGDASHFQPADTTSFALRAVAASTLIPHRLVNGGRCRPRLVNAGLIGRN